jgi:hypothetical protein
VSADVFIIVESPSARMWTAAGDGGDGLRSAFLQDGLRPRANDVEYGTAKHYGLKSGLFRKSGVT